MRVCLFVCSFVLRHAQEYFIHMDTSPLPGKGCQIYTIYFDLRVCVCVCVCVCGGGGGGGGGGNDSISSECHYCKKWHIFSVMKCYASH